MYFDGNDFGGLLAGTLMTGDPRAETVGAGARRHAAQLADRKLLQPILREDRRRASTPEVTQSRAAFGGHSERDRRGGRGRSSRPNSDGKPLLTGDGLVAPLLSDTTSAQWRDLALDSHFEQSEAQQLARLRRDGVAWSARTIVRRRLVRQPKSIADRGAIGDLCLRGERQAPRKSPSQGRLRLEVSAAFAPGRRPDADSARREAFSAEKSDHAKRAEARGRHELPSSSQVQLLEIVAAARARPPIRARALSARIAARHKGLMARLPPGRADGGRARSPGALHERARGPAPTPCASGWTKLRPAGARRGRSTRAMPDRLLLRDALDLVAHTSRWLTSDSGSSITRQVRTEPDGCTDVTSCSGRRGKSADGDATECHRFALIGRLLAAQWILEDPRAPRPDRCRGAGIERTAALREGSAGSDTDLIQLQPYPTGGVFGAHPGCVASAASWCCQPRSILSADGVLSKALGRSRPS